MGKSLTRKILESHLVEGEWKSGSEIGIRIDQTLTQDATGTMAYLQFEAMGLGRSRHRALGQLHRPQHLADGLRERRRPPLPPLDGAPLRHPPLPGGQRHLPPGPPGALRQAGRDPPRLRQPYAHRRRHRHGGHRRGRPRRGPRDGGRAFLPALPRGGPRGPQGRLCGPGSRPRTSPSRCSRLFGTKGNVGRVFEYAGPGLASPLGARARDRGQHGRRVRRHHLDLPERRGDPRLPRAPRGARRTGGPSPPTPTPSTRRRSRSTSGALEPLAAAPHSPGNVVTVRSLAGGQGRPGLHRLLHELLVQGPRHRRPHAPRPQSCRPT